MALPARLLIDGCRTSCVHERLTDMRLWPVKLRTARGCLSGRMELVNDGNGVVQLSPLVGVHPDADGAVDEPVPVLVRDIVEITVLRESA